MAESRPRAVLELWVDDRPPYLLHRVTRLLARRTELVIDVTYTEEAQLSSCYPTGWRQTTFEGNAAKGIRMTRTVSNVKWEASPTPLSNEELEVRFPSGTLIYDDSDGPNAAVRFVASDGTRHDVPAELLTKSYDEISKEANQQAKADRQMRWLYPVLAIAIAGLFVRNRSLESVKTGAAGWALTL